MDRTKKGILISFIKRFVKINKDAIPTEPTQSQDCICTNCLKNELHTKSEEEIQKSYPDCDHTELIQEISRCAFRYSNYYSSLQLFYDNPQLNINDILNYSSKYARGAYYDRNSKDLKGKSALELNKITEPFHNLFEEIKIIDKLLVKEIYSNLCHSTDMLLPVLFKQLSKITKEEEFIENYLMLFYFRVHYSSNFFEKDFNNIYLVADKNNTNINGYSESNPINALYVQNGIVFWRETLKNEWIKDLIVESMIIEDKPNLKRLKKFFEDFKLNKNFQCISSNVKGFKELEMRIESKDEMLKINRNSNIDDIFKIIMNDEEEVTKKKKNKNKKKNKENISTKLTQKSTNINSKLGDQLKNTLTIESFNNHNNTNQENHENHDNDNEFEEFKSKLIGDSIEAGVVKKIKPNFKSIWD